MNNQHYTVKPIGILHSCFKQKFGIPRQHGIAPSATATLSFYPPWHRRELFSGIEAFSHIWIHFIFHQCLSQGWKTSIRPPRLGGKERRGIFATRSMHRPNAIGQSIAKIEKIETLATKGTLLHLSGIDILDQTPVIDIKPYLPYCDAIDHAKETFLSDEKRIFNVLLSDSAEKFCFYYQIDTQRNLKKLLIEILQQDPRPGYLQTFNSDKLFYVTLWDTNTCWKVEKESITVLTIEKTSDCSSL